MQKCVYIKKKRNTAIRKPKKILLLSLEGSNKTERQYFSDFESKFYKIRIINSNTSDSVKMMKELRDEFKRLGLSAKNGDVGISIVDSDFDSKKDNLLKEADVIAAKNKNLYQIVSAPCFEIWFLCHYIFSLKSYNTQNEVVNELRKYIPYYEKSAEGLYDALSDKLDVAIKNAKALEKHLCSSQKSIKRHTISFAPSTEVFKIVELLLFDKHELK